MSTTEFCIILALVLSSALVILVWRAFRVRAGEQEFLFTKTYPYFLLGLTALTIFIAEVVVMFIIPLAPGLTPLAKALLDAGLLTALAGPALYLCIVRPLIRTISQGALADEKLRHSAAILKAVGAGAERFMKGTDWKGELASAVAMLGEAVGVCRVYVFMNCKDETGCLRARLYHEWVEPGEELQACPVDEREFSYESSLNEWVDTLSKGEPAHGVIEAIDVQKLPAFLRRGAKSFVIAPVHVGETWWGFIGFNDHHVQRRWDSRELEGLKMAANTLGAAIKRTRAEAQIEDSGRKVRSILSAVGEGIIAIDSDSRITMVNEELLSIFGYREEELLGKCITLLMPEKYWSAHLAGMKRYIEEGNARVLGHRLELEATHKNGRVFPIDIRIEEVVEGPDSERFFTSAIRDISERKGAEQEREALITDLTRANDELKDFAYVVSHDLKAPLRAISSLAGWIEQDNKDKLDDEGRENLEMLMGRVQRMNNLIEGILQYSRVGRVKAEPRLLDSNKVVSDVIDMLSQPDSITIRIEEALPSVVYDVTRLEQVFQNLLGNAILHMEKLDGEVSVSCRQTGGFWEFCVADNGIGIDQRHFERIFKIFQSLKSRDEQESTGIGLALVKKIVETGGGRIYLVSEKGKGSKFYFTIPK